MPMQNQVWKQRTAQRHDHPITQDRRTLGRSRNVVKRHAAIAQANRPSLKNAFEEPEEFPWTEGSYVPQIVRYPRIHMMHFKSRICPQSLQHMLHHRTLSVMRWWSVGKDENFTLLQVPSRLAQLAAVLYSTLPRQCFCAFLGNFKRSSQRLHATGSFAQIQGVGLLGTRLKTSKW